MRSVTRVLAALAMGLALVVGPALVADGSGVEARAASASVTALAQDPTPGGQQPAPAPAPPPEQEQPRDDLSRNQRYVIGAVGAVVILLVLMLRKARGKSPLGVRLRRRG